MRIIDCIGKRELLEREKILGANVREKGWNMQKSEEVFSCAYGDTLGERRQYASRAYT